MQSNKVKVRNGNVVFRVDPSEVKKYYEMGYDVYGADGKIEKRAMPTDIPTLQKAFMDHEAEIQKLKEEIRTLKAEGAVKTMTPRRTAKKNVE